MADSFPSSRCADTEGYSSNSDLSLSVGYFPGEDTVSYENTTACEDTSSKGPSIHSVPPFQGSWQNESTEKLLGRQDQIQDGPQQLCKLSIALAWDTDSSSNHSDSVISWGLHGDNHWRDKYPKEKTQLTLSKLNGLVRKLEQFLQSQKDDEDDKSMLPECAQKDDFQLSSGPPADTAQVSHRERDTCQDLPMLGPQENEDVIWFSQIPPRIRKHELVETISQATGNQRTSPTESASVSSDGPEEDTHSSTQALSCLNVGRLFRWLRQQVLSAFGGRGDLQRATEHPRELAGKKKLFRRSKRIQPQESIELEPPILPDFKTS